MEFEIITQKEPCQEIFIYNCFDIIYHDTSYLFVKDGADEFKIPLHIEKGTAFLGVYLKDFPRPVLEGACHYLFKSNRKVKRVSLKNTLTCFKDHLQPEEHWRVELPGTVEELLQRVTQKSAYNMRRSERKLRELGEVEFVHLPRKDITEDIVTPYFKFKKDSYGTNYGLRWDEYLRKYFVTDAYILKVDSQVAAIAFTCEQCSDVFLENISFDPQYSKYSAGIQVYTYCLRELIRSHKHQLCLGIGTHEYKKRFGSISEEVYSGSVYRNQCCHIAFSVQARLKAMLAK